MIPNQINSLKCMHVQVKDLRSAASKSPDGVIPMNNKLFDKFAAGNPRPYSLVIFFTADKMKQDNTNLKLGELRDNFGLMVRHYRSTFPDSDRIFFCEVELADSKEVFHRMDVNTLPWVAHIAPGNVMKCVRTPVENTSLHRANFP